MRKQAWKPQKEMEASPMARIASGMEVVLATTTALMMWAGWVIRGW